MLAGQLPDAVVANEYVPAFKRLSAPFIDGHVFERLNDTYWSSMLRDPRYPASPTRQRGVWHVCSECDEFGFFEDERTGLHVRSEDWRYRAAHVFRFIGWALAQVGAACPSLWDAAEPAAVNLGGYVSKPCEPLPEPVLARI